MTTAIPRSKEWLHWAFRRPLVQAFMLTSFLFAIVLAIFTPAYETNDDAVMSMIASGTGACISPDEHLIFSHVAIGLALKELYTLCPDFPWYGAYLLGVQFLAILALTYTLLAWHQDLREFPRYALVLVAVGIPFMTTLQFTRTGCFATECGLLLALGALLRPTDEAKRNSRLPLVCGIALMVLGSMVRYQSFFAVLALATPVVGFVLWRVHCHSATGRRMWRTAFLTALATLGLVAAFRRADRAYYERDPAWRDFLEVNNLRVLFNDYPGTQYSSETGSAFQRVKWSENDHALIEHWFYDDPTVYSVDNLREIAKSNSIHRALAAEALAALWGDLLQDRSLWPLFLCLPALIWSARDRRLVLESLAVAVIVLIVVVTYLMCLKTPPARVTYPLFAFLPLLSLLPARRGKDGEAAAVELDAPTPSRGFSWQQFAPTWSGKLVWTMAALGAGVVFFVAFVDGQIAQERNSILKSYLAELAPRDDELFVTWSCCFPYDAVLPTDSPAFLRHTHLLSLGWMQQSPLNRAMKDHFQIDDLARELSARPNVYLISMEPLNDLYSQFCREHQSTELQWENHFECPQFSIWKPSLTDAVAELHKTGSPPSQRR